MRYKIKINGQSWTYSVISPEFYIREHGPDSVAITDTTNRRMDFMPETASLGNIIHELVHAYKSYLCLEDATMGDDAYEEIYATFFSRNGISIIETALKMYGKMNKDDSVTTLVKSFRKANKIC